MSDTIKDLNPHEDGRKGRRRTRSCIVGGIFISYEQGLEWYQRTYDEELAADHTEDITIAMALWGEFERRGVDSVRSVRAIAPCTKCHPDPSFRFISWDFLIVTHIEPGPFCHEGVGGCEYVVDEERKPLPGVTEAKVRDQLREWFGIQSLGYKSLYSDVYYPWLRD